MKNKFVLFGLFFLFGGFFAYANRNKLPIVNKVFGEKENFLFGETLRVSDSQGKGHYGAPRKGGKIHKGLDIVKLSGSFVNAPFDCKIKRLGFVSTKHKELKLIEIEGTNKFKGFTAKLMYVETLLKPSETVFKQGAVIGKVQDITKVYIGITNHIHLELYKDGININPENYV